MTRFRKGLATDQIRFLFLAPVALLVAAAEASARQPDPNREDLLCASAILAIDDAVAKTLARGSPGMIVEIAQGDRTLFSRSYGTANLELQTPIRRNSVFRLASITKMFTAAAALSLVEEGKLSLDDHLSTHLPEMPEATADVRVYDLLVQTSGIPDFSEDPEILESKSVRRTTAEMVSLVGRKAAKLNFQPGTQWEYSNSNYVLLGAIAERVTGEELAGIFDKRLFEPAGLTSIQFDDPEQIVANRVSGYRRYGKQKPGFANAAWISPSIPGAAGGLLGAAPDLVRWSHALFAGTLIRPSFVSLMSAPGRLRDGRTTKLGMPEAWREGLNSDYGMGLFIKQTTAGTRLAHSGDIEGFSTWFAHYPASRVTIIQMINSESVDLDVEAVEAAVFQSGTRPCLRDQS